MDKRWDRHYQAGIVIVNHLSLLIFVCGLLTALSSLWLLVMILFPRQWSRFVDKENAFWVGTKLISPSRVEQIKRLEKGTAAKIMAAFLMVLSMVMLGVSLHFLKLVNPPRRKPALPTLHPRIAPTNSHRTQP